MAFILFALMLATFIAIMRIRQNSDLGSGHESDKLGAFQVETYFQST